MDVVIVTKEWDMGVACLAMESANKQFNSLSAKNFFVQSIPSFSFDYMYMHIILTQYMHMCNLMSDCGHIYVIHNFLVKTVILLSIVGGYPVLFYFQLYTVSIHVQLSQCISHVLLCYAV